jgi:isopropylmalate/homocitrate/citramalate synthase
VVDSQGVARPGAIAFLVKHLKANTGLKVELHCHNDFGLAVANVLAGYEAGADVLQVSVNGVGYRAGNAAMESVVMALEVLYGVDTGVRLDLLYDTCRMVEAMTGLANGYFKPIVGDGAFRFEQWTMADRFTRAGERRYAFPFEPEVVGRVPEVVIGKWSDKQAVIQKLAEYGLSASAEQVEKIQSRSQRLGAAKKRALRDDEFLVVAEAVGVTEV